MINRVLLVVIDGLGVGALPDAAQYGDTECNTLASLCEAADSLRLPNFQNLGLGHLGAFPGIRPIAQPEGCFGRLGFVSKGKDSLTGHWEIAGCPLDEKSGVETEFTTSLAAMVEEAIGQKTLGNRAGSGFHVVEESIAAHRQSGAPIAWVDDIGAIHLAGHESVVSAEDLYRMAREVRRVGKQQVACLRVIAHPFSDVVGSLTSGERRRHFATEPPGPTLFDQLSRASQLVVGLGKVGDLFSGRGVTRSSVTAGYRETLDELLGLFSRVPRGLLFATIEPLSPSLEASIEGMQDIDRRLPELYEKLKPGDVLIITADHGADMSRSVPGHSREYVPLLVMGPKLARGVNLGTRMTAADLGQTIGEALAAARLPIGESFLDSLRAG
jgi:phosphopentomutase